ncbi:MAG TPA: RNA 2',3'-cyclic phosphodiesterase [Acidobacteriota bacterium]|nr:RNA 2',3'-cyclic phosphodiesterase [Acidobacteriota bacterium]
MRTFIAVPLPPECQRMLGEIQSGLLTTNADVRWVAISSIHLTLKFLGEIDPARIPQLADALHATSSAQAGFSLRIHGLGVFPNVHNPRVVWCGIDGEVPRLQHLQADVERACAGMGFEPENRDFHPHLTLGRVQGKRNLQHLLDYIRIGSELECTFHVDRYDIFKSTLTPRGAIYDVLKAIPLRI